ncbi:MAG: sugar ABC transporter ATP-binding protein [Christensenellales bacterium]|jgi:ABC-type sugar transport system ATPase subunit
MDEAVVDDVILRVENITKLFPGVRALDDVSMEVKRGEIHALLGENGAGKSTLIKILTGVYKQDSGNIYLEGKKVHIDNPIQSRELGIGTVFQENSLLPHLSVAENIFLTSEIRNKLGFINWRKTYQQCRKWINDLGVDLDPRARVRDLSVAQQQVVEIVKMFSKDPKIVILDEPTSALSDNEIDNLFNIVLRMQEKGITFIYISHRMEELKRIGNGGTVLRDGKKVGELEDVTHMDQDEIIKLIVGRTLDEKFPEREHKIGDVMFEVKDLTVPKTIYDINFNLRRGEVLGLSGLVGSGRTSIAKAIFGALPRASGKFFLEGKELNLHGPQDAIGAGIGLLPEDRKVEGLLLEKPISWNITLPSLRRYKHLGVVINRRLERKDVMDYKDVLEIKTPSLEREVKFLSGGNQQKVVFSKWLCAQSKVYIFDEPTRGIDVGTKSEIYKIINKLVTDGNGVIVISSELPEILGICDRILVMHEGVMTGELLREEATQEKIMYYSIGGTDDVN